MCPCRSPVFIETKGDNSPVTEADRKAEEAMSNLIKEKFPDHSVFGEELGMHTPDGDSQYLWVLDPIDGTKSFITGACSNDEGPAELMWRLPRFQHRAQIEVHQGSLRQYKPSRADRSECLQLQYQGSAACMGPHLGHFMAASKDVATKPTLTALIALSSVCCPLLQASQPLEP